MSRVALVSLMLLGCGGGADAPVADAHAAVDATLPPDAQVDAQTQADRFDIDILEHGSSITVHLDQRAATCCEAIFRWPGVEGCTGTSDHQGCTCDPWGCVTSVRLERSGTVVQEAANFANGPPFFFTIDLTAQPVDVVVEGCGKIERQTVTHADGGGLVATWIETNGTDLTTVEWTELSPLSHTVLSNGLRCLEPADGAASLPGAGADVFGGFGLQAYSLDESRSGAYGAVRVWHGGGGQSWDGFAPNKLPDGRWALPWIWTDVMVMTVSEAAVDTVINFRPTAGVAMAISGDELLADIIGLSWLFGETPAMGHTFRYVQGPATDQISIALDDGEIYEGSIPHIALLALSSLGPIVPVSLDIDIPSITVARVSDPTVTRTISFAFTWDLGVVARPIP